MAAPTPTVRVAPNGILVPEGFKYLITFARVSNLAIWEKGGKPTGLDNGDKINITTHHNNKTRTFYPRKLYEPTDGSLKVAIDAKSKNEVRTKLIGIPDTITETWPDGSTYCYYGYCKSLEFSDFQEGEFPEADIVIVQTNYDHVNRTEAEAVFTEVAGT